MASPPDKGAPDLSRRSFVTAAAAAALGSHDTAHTAPEVGNHTISPPRAPNASFDPWIEVDLLRKTSCWSSSPGTSCSRLTATSRPHFSPESRSAQAVSFAFICTSTRACTVWECRSTTRSSGQGPSPARAACESMGHSRSSLKTPISIGSRRLVFGSCRPRQRSAA